MSLLYWRHKVFNRFVGLRYCNSIITTFVDAPVCAGHKGGALHPAEQGAVVCLVLHTT